MSILSKTKGYWTGKKRLSMTGKNHWNWKGGKPKCLECNKIITWGYKYCHKHVVMNEKSYKWVGDKVGYRGLHNWVENKLGKPQKCEFCETTINRRYHWANISHEYKRDLSDWIRLCVPCHKLYDTDYKKGRIYV